MRLYKKTPSGIWYIEVKRGKAFSLGTRDKEEALKIAAPQMDESKKVCHYCGDVIVGWSRKYCSQRCRLSSQAESLRFGDKRADIIERFGSSCYFCKTTKNLVVHHIDGRGANESRANKNNDPENLIPMCASCHRKLHSLINKSRGMQAAHQSA